MVGNQGRNRGHGKLSINFQGSGYEQARASIRRKGRYTYQGGKNIRVGPTARTRALTVEGAAVGLKQRESEVVFVRGIDRASCGGRYKSRGKRKGMGFDRRKD